MNDTTVLAGLAGIILSLLLAYIPGLKDKFGALEPARKQLFMLVLLFSATSLIGIGNCSGLSIPMLPIYECSTQGAVDLFGLFFAAITGNVVGYQSTNYIKQ